MRLFIFVQREAGEVVSFAQLPVESDFDIIASVFEIIAQSLKKANTAKKYYVVK